MAEEETREGTRCCNLSVYDREHYVDSNDASSLFQGGNTGQGTYYRHVAMVLHGLHCHICTSLISEIYNRGAILFFFEPLVIVVNENFR